MTNGAYGTIRHDFDQMFGRVQLEPLLVGV